MWVGVGVSATANASDDSSRAGHDPTPPEPVEHGGIANELTAFEELQADVDSNPDTYLGAFRNRMQRTVTSAENATSREMTTDGFTVTTSRNSQPDVELGVVTYQFEWQQFAAVTDEQIRAGDALDQL